MWCWGVIIVSMVFIVIKNTKAWPASEVSGKEACNLFRSFKSSNGKVIRQYCYKCDHLESPQLNHCVNPVCNDPTFDFIENGTLAYYECRGNCGGQPLACNALKTFDNGEWSCTEDIEQKLTPRKFLACQTCHAVCFHGYQLRQHVTNSCVRRNETHIGWNTNETEPNCISITQICGRPDISGVTLEDCVTYDDLNSSTNQHSFHQECTARCRPGLWQVSNVSTACGEDGHWSDLDRLETLCVDPSLGCELPESSGSWNCSGIWFDSSHASSGAVCRLDCGDQEGYGNALVCTNTHLSRLHANLQQPFCYTRKEEGDIKETRYGPITIIVAVVGVLVFLSVCYCCRRWELWRIPFKNFSICSNASSSLQLEAIPVSIQQPKGEIPGQNQQLIAAIPWSGACYPDPVSTPVPGTLESGFGYDETLDNLLPSRRRHSLDDAANRLADLFTLGSMRSGGDGQSRSLLQ